MASLKQLDINISQTNGNGKKSEKYDKDTEKLINEFKEEAVEYIDECDRILSEFIRSENKIDKSTLNSLFRAIHTIKGTAAYTGLTAITETAHCTETLLEKIRKRKELYLTDNELDFILFAVDVLKELIVNLSAKNKFDENSLIEEFKITFDLLINEKSGYTKSENVREQTMNFQYANPLGIFIESAEQHIQTLKKGIKELSGKKKTSDKSIYNEIFRAAHSLKSSSSYMGFDTITNLANMLENELNQPSTLFINKANRKNLPKSDTIDIKEIAKIVEAIEEEINDLKKPNKISLNEKYGKQNHKTIQQNSPLRKNNPTILSKYSMGPGESIRVKLTALDDFINLTGELVTAKNNLLYLEKQFRESFGFLNTKKTKSHPLQKDITSDNNNNVSKLESDSCELLNRLHSVSQNINRSIEALQRKITELRVIPLQLLLEKTPKIVYETCRKAGKEAVVKFSGEHTAIDKSIIDKLSDPLIHILRNAIAHGIEYPEEREKRGKKRYGTILLNASVSGSRIEIKINDDGRGIDIEKIRRKAVEKGIISKTEAKKMQHEQLINLIFYPGFTTAEKITDTSGRGIGMDAVYTAIKNLKGDVFVTSQYEKGTTITFSIPISRSVTQIILFDAGNEIYGLPIEDIDEIINISDQKMIKSILTTKVIPYRKNIIPILSVSDLFCGTARQQNLSGLIKESETPASNLNEINKIIITTAAHGEKIGLAIKCIVGKETAVIKPFPEWLNQNNIIFGTTILGNGNIVLIINPGSYRHRINKNREEEEK